MKKTNLRNRKGFTLVEMLAVVIIVALLASIIFPAVGNAITRNAAATNAANLRAVEGQLRILRLTHPDDFETWLDTVNTWLGESNVNLLKSLVDLFTGGAATRYENDLRTVISSGGTLTLMNGASVSTPGSVHMSYTYKNHTWAVEAGAQMGVYLGEDDIYCHYNGIPVEVFEAIAEGREPNIEEDDSGQNLIQNVLDAIKNWLENLFGWL